MSDYKGTKTPTPSRGSSFAAAVSRTLRAAGIHTVGGSSPRNRQAVRVRNDGHDTVAVTVDYDRDGEARRMADVIVEVLTEKNRRTTRQDDNRVLVHRDGTAADSRDTRHLVLVQHDDYRAYPSIRATEVAIYPQSDELRSIQLTTRVGGIAELTSDEAVKLAEQLYHAATGKELPR